MRHPNYHNTLRRLWTGLLGLVCLLLISAAPAYAGKDCSGAFTITLSDGRVISGAQNNVSVPVGGGVTAQVRGRFVAFDVNLDTFKVTNYTLNSDITAGRATVIFLRKEPLHGKVLNSNLSVTLSQEQLVLQRTGAGQSMKIQAKDCSEGGIFQMEPEPTVTVEHELAAPFAYCVDSLNRVLIVSATNPFIGRESPETATLTFPTPLSAIVGTRRSRWLVQGGGRMGMVTGEDAVQPLTGVPCTAGGPTPTPTPSPTPSPSPTGSPTPTPSPTPGAVTHVEINLVGAPLNGATPRGEAELQRRVDGSREFEVKVSNVNLPAGTVLNVLLDGTRVGSFTLTSLLTGEFELDTRDGQPTPPIVNGTAVTITTQAGATILAGVFTVTLPPPGPTPTPTPPPPPPPGGEVRLRIPLAGAAVNGVIPKGRADYRQRTDGRIQFEVEVEDVNLPAGTIFTVLVNNANVGQLVLNSFFKGELELNTGDGQSAPQVTAGTVVTVVNSANATLVAGVFGTNSGAAAVVNPLEDTSFFVRQQYIDFLNRAPDEAGLNSWVRVLEACPENGYGTTHVECDRVQVSSGFYRSNEFLGRGYFLYRAYDAVLGRLPRYAEFLPELGRIGQAQTEIELEQIKDAYVAELLQRPEFNARYNGLTTPGQAENFVTRLETTAGVRLASHAQLVADMQTGRRSTAQTLRTFLDSPEVYEQFIYRGFVTMQYFGYLRRDPEAAGWNVWVNILTHGREDVQQGDYRTLIFGFVHSQEYRNRFGQP